MSFAWLLAACVDADAGGAEHVVLRGAHLPGGAAADVEFRRGTVLSVGHPRADGAVAVDVSGRFLAPAFVDSHVHLAYLPLGLDLLDGGVAAVVDLAAPLRVLARPPAGPRWKGAGPMITAVGGYPTRSWGQDGYGLEVTTPEEAAAAVSNLRSAGAAVVKIPFDGGGPVLSDEAIAAAVGAAHAEGLLVFAHALGEAAAARAARLGVDGLAHTPVEPLTPATIAAWRGRYVISTLRAFGGSDTAVANLRSLRASGAVVLYGTDFGNTTETGIDREEVRLLGEAGLDGAAILAAGTSVPAKLWGYTDLGSVEVGKAASLLVLDADPSVDPSTLTRPVTVWMDGLAR